MYIFVFILYKVTGTGLLVLWLCSRSWRSGSEDCWLLLHCSPSLLCFV